MNKRQQYALDCLYNNEPIDCQMIDELSIDKLGNEPKPGAFAEFVTDCAFLHQILSDEQIADLSKKISLAAVMMFQIALVDQGAQKEQITATLTYA